LSAAEKGTAVQVNALKSELQLMSAELEQANAHAVALAKRTETLERQLDGGHHDDKAYAPLRLRLRLLFLT